MLKELHIFFKSVTKHTHFDFSLKSVCKPKLFIKFLQTHVLDF